MTKQHSDAPSSLGRNALPEIDSTESTTQPLDALADTMRLLGRNAYDLPRQSRQEFQAECEKWVQHLLLGRSIEATAPSAMSNGPVRRRWQELREFLATRRQQETEFVEQLLAHCEAGLAEATREIHRQSEKNTATQAQLSQALDALENSVADLPPGLERRAVSDQVDALRQQINQQRLTQRYGEQRTLETLTGLRDHIDDASGSGDLDPLTKVHTRGAFQQHFEHVASIARATGEPVTLGIIDINHLDATNREYGSHAGDSLLRAVADCTVRCFPRKHDYIARLGGSTFALVLRDLDQQSAHRLMQRLSASLCDIRLDTPNVTLSCSVASGYTQLAVHERLSDCYERACRAMNHAKQSQQSDAVHLPHPQ